MGGRRSGDSEDARDRARLLRRIGWERAGVRVFRLAIAIAALATGVVRGLDDDVAEGLVFFAFGLLLLWEFARPAPAGGQSTRDLTVDQRAVLETTMRQDGRLAAVQQLRSWTGASYSEATRDIDAAFPEAPPPPA